MRKRLFATTMMILLLVQVLYLPILAADSVSLPSGYVDPWTFYTRGSKEEEPAVYVNWAEVQNAYVTMYSVSNSTFEAIKYSYAFWVIDGIGDFEWDSFDGGMEWKRGEENDSFVITGSQHLNGDGKTAEDGALVDDSDHHYTIDYSFRLEISNVRYGTGEQWEQTWTYLDVKGTEEAKWTITDKNTGVTENYSASRQIDQTGVAGRLIENASYELQYGGLRESRQGDTYLQFYVSNGDQENDPFYQYIGVQDGITFGVQVIGIKPVKGIKIEGVEQNAKDEAGEDDGVFISDDIVDGSGKDGSGKESSGKGSSKSDSVKSGNDYDDDGLGVGGAVAVGVLSTGAAAGAGAAAASSGKGKSNGGKKKKSYKMYLQKDFGDAIRRGAPPVKIRARMAEIDENGKEHDRNDLTALITVSGDGTTIENAALSGRYCEATVSVPMDNQNDKANVIFTFNGQGGSFNNTVIFRLTDGPALKFVEETQKAGTFNLYHESCGIEAIPGDGFTYTKLFMIVDAPNPPKLTDIVAVNTGEFDVKFETTDRQSVYKMIVKNNTKPEPEHDVFAKVKEEHFEIHVTVEGEKEPVIGYVTMEMYPEGITISSDMEGKKKDVKYVRVQAFEKENVGDFDKKWQVSQIKFTLAFKGKDKAIIDPEETKFKFAKLKGAGGLGMRADKEESLAEKYQYKEAHTWMNDKYVYEFEPQAHLCEPSDGTFMMVLLPVTCTYESVKHEAEIPLRLRGKDMDPMENWEEEYKKLRERLEKYSLPAEKDKWLERIENMATDPRASVEELRLTSKMLVRNYMRYWEIEGIKSRQDAELYDNIINQLEWAKFFGDCAFSFLVNAYAGPVAEAILSPTKDFLTEAIGETIASWSRGQSVDFDKFNFSKNVLAAGDNLVSGQIGFDNWKKAAYTLGAYFAYASLKNFYMTLREDNKFDLYGALVKGFSDMTSAGLKAAASHLFDAWLKNNVQFRKKMSIWCGQLVTKHFGAGALFDLRNVEGITKSEIVRKYLDGLFGMAIDKLIETDVEIHNQFITSENGFEFDQNGHVIIQFFFEVEGSNYDCKIDATQAVVSAASGLFGYVFELLFGEVPFAASVVEMPTDPPLPPEK